MKNYRWLPLPLLLGLLSIQACSSDDGGDIFGPVQGGAGQGGQAGQGQAGTAGSSTGAGQGGAAGTSAGQGGSSAGQGGNEGGASGEAGQGGSDQGGAGQSGQGGDTGQGGSEVGGTNAGGTTQGGNGGSGTSGAGNGGSGGSDPCAGTESTVLELNKLPLPLPKTPYRLKGVVATSQKYLVSTAATGCLWGVFVSAPGSEIVEYGSIQLISQGAAPTVDGSGKAVCPTNSDKIPNDIQPGDVLDLTGTLDEFLLQQCGQNSNPKPEVGQRQIKEPTCLQVTAKGAALISPKIISGTSVVDTIAQGKNTNDLLRKYAGALVKLEGSFSSTQTPINAYPPGSAVSKYGEIHVQQTALSINNNIYYNDLTCGGPRDNAKHYDYSHPTTFTSFTGILSLDFCTWQLAIRERCGDIAPLSSVCDGPECSAGGSGGSGGAGGGNNGPEDTAALCSDGLDNDGDNFIDCEDKGCCNALDCKTFAPGSYCAKLSPELDSAACTDGLDNDLDGYIDCEDKGCCAFVDCKTIAPGSYCATQGSGGAGGGSGGAENTAALCSDGQDNDGDNFIDCEDKDCCALVNCALIAPGSYCGKQAGNVPENTPELCQDGKSNDGDNFIDCEDKDCCPVVDCKTLAPGSFCAKQP